MSETNVHELNVPTLQASLRRRLLHLSRSSLDTDNDLLLLLRSRRELRRGLDIVNRHGRFVSQSRRVLVKGRQESGTDKERMGG